MLFMTIMAFCHPFFAACINKITTMTGKIPTGMESINKDIIILINTSIKYSNVYVISIIPMKLYDIW